MGITKKKGESSVIQVGLVRILYTVLWVIVLSGISQNTEAQTKPEWLEHYPADPRFYIGIGGASKAELGTVANQHARETALAELISQIEVSVSSDQVLIETASDEEYAAFFNSLVKTQASKSIENYEVVDSWENDDEVWVYLRLSKQDYERRVQEKMGIAKRQAMKALEDGDISRDSGDFLKALGEYTRGMSEVVPFMDRPMEVTTDAGRIDILAELQSRINQIVTEFEITSSEGPKTGQVGGSVSEPFILKVVYKATGKPATNVPVSFHFIRGGGDFGDAVKTNAQGMAQGQLRKITAPDKMQIINGGIAFEAFSDPESGIIVRQLLARSNAPTARYVLRVSGVPVYMEYSEQFLGEAGASNYFQPVLQGELNDAGYTFIEELGDADLYMEVETNLKKGSETYGIYSAYLEYSITITNMQTGEEIASYSVTDIKGMSDSYEKAGAKAYEAGLGQLKEEIIPELISRIQQ